MNIKFKTNEDAIEFMINNNHLIFSDNFMEYMSINGSIHVHTSIGWVLLGNIFETIPDLTQLNIDEY